MNRDLTPFELADAEDRVCADVDTLCDWLYGVCFQAPVQTPPYVWRAQDFDASEHATPLLLAVAFVPGQRSEIVLAAIRELRERYVAAKSAYVVTLASGVEA